MKVPRVANSPVFGYNKELNEKVNDKLRKAKGNKELAGTLLALNTYCMETEDKLRKAESENNRRLVNEYDYLLLGIKEIAVNNINDRFPELDYRQKEYDTYVAEANEKKNPHSNYWLNQMVLILNESIEEDKAFAAEIENLKKPKRQIKTQN